MEWLLLGAVGLGVVGWVLALRYRRNLTVLKRLLGESVMLTQTAIDQNAGLIAQNEAILTDLTIATSLLNSGSAVTSADSTITATIH